MYINEASPTRAGNIIFNSLTTSKYVSLSNIRKPSTVEAKLKTTSLELATTVSAVTNITFA